MRSIAAATALTLAAATCLAIASPAHAETFPITDSFDDPSRWTSEEIPGSTSTDVASFPGARSAPNMAYLDSYPIGPYEARIFRAITLNNGASLPRSCTASIWATYAQQVDLGNVNVNLKVHSGGPTGQIISVIGAQHLREGWIQRNFAPIPWPANSRTITVEIAAYHGVAMLDDFSINCR
ncbi:hypothetical protein DMB66_31300 [Actinoplanes sp. ATCC 53533]|uniref:hypothetical protein n=1 Tax=Actinoplanes sp. ATCC 53533 TaxID=1288362 RepID=UPI000F7AF0B1|nr:hypothetical protein [Actinoplanes sp. ATCC 53533]RSM57990.1 hypothetical protein DMB66_31300 [Actinoplanes sp. ATCC 53533]